MFSIEESSPNFRNTCAVAIVGNKIDLASERCVSQEDGKSLAKLYGTPFYEVSAKTGENISTVFSDLAAALHKKNKKSAEHNNGNVSLSETKKNKFKQKCCGK